MNRKALLIGINNYDHFLQLDNCENDAKDISDLLLDNGFDCELLLNPDLRTIIQKLSEYKKSLEKNTLSFIYFSGHGLQVEGDNFLVPKDASIYRTEEIPYFCVHASDLLVDIGYESLITHIVVLDACRDNRFKSGIKGITDGLAKMDAPMGTLIAFSTSPNTTSRERKNERNGIYTKHLLQFLNMPSLEIQQVFRKTRTNVIRDTGGKQVPWEENSLFDTDIFINESSLIPENVSTLINSWCKGQNLSLPQSFSVLGTIDLDNISIDIFQFILSLVEICHHEEQFNENNRRTLDQDFYTEKMLEYYSILQQRILQENDCEVILEINDLNRFQIKNDKNYGYNDIDPPEDTFPQLWLNDIFFDGHDCLFSLFLTEDIENNEYLLKPILFLKTKSLDILAFPN